MTTGSKKLVIGDRILWVVIVFLSIISLIEVYSSIGKAAYDHGWSVNATVLKHIAIVVASYCVIVAVSHVPFKWFSRLSQPGYYISLLMMIVMFGLSLFSKLSGASDGHAAFRWFNIPVIGQFQPSEIAKFILLIYLARQISKYRDSLNELDTFKKLMRPVVIVSVLIFPENFSTAAIVFMACMVLMYLGGVNRKYLFSTLTIVVVAVVLFLLCCFTFKIELFRSETWVNRIDEWLNSDKSAITQTNLAKIAIAIGGITGRGIGNTVQGRFLNESHTDFIYSVITEELGLLWALLIILAYVIFFIRCINISRGCDSIFGQLATAGLGFIIFFQALINMGVATGYLPVTGQTLPLISYGGTSYILTSSAIGVILAVSRKNKMDSLKKQIVDDNNETEIESKSDNKTNDGSNN